MPRAAMARTSISRTVKARSERDRCAFSTTA